MPAPTSSATASTRPEPQSPTGVHVSDHRQLDLAVDDLHAFDRAVGGTHAAADLRRLERRAGRRRRRQRTGRRAEHDLGVRADVDEEAQALVERQPGGEDAGHDVGPDVGAEGREEHGRGALVHAHAEVGGGCRRQLPRGDRERRHRERLGIDPERELDHRDVAGDDDLVDLGRVDTRLVADLRGQRRKRLVRLRAQDVERARVEHRRADPRDHVRAERLLGVEDRAHRSRLAGLEVEQRRDARGRAEVVGDRVAPRRRVAGLDVEQQVVDDDRRHVPVRVAQRLAERAHELERHAQLEVVHRVRDALEIRDLVLERRLAQLEMALLHGRPEDHVPPHPGERRLRPRLQQRHLDDEVLLRLRAAGEPPAGLQLVGRERARVDRRELLPAGGDAHLAFLAGAVTAAGRVDRDAVPARAVEQRRAGGDARFLRRAVRLLEDEPNAVRVDLLELRRSARVTPSAPPASCGRRRSRLHPTRRGRAGSRSRARPRRSPGSARP